MAAWSAAFSDWSVFTRVSRAFASVCRVVIRVSRAFVCVSKAPRRLSAKDDDAGRPGQPRQVPQRLVGTLRPEVDEEHVRLGVQHRSCQRQSSWSTST